jgi:hypothetical protein
MLARKSFALIFWFPTRSFDGSGTSAISCAQWWKTSAFVSEVLALAALRTVKPTD